MADFKSFYGSDTARSNGIMLGATQVLPIGGNPPRELNNTTAKITPSTENKGAKRAMVYPSFTESSESALKTPFCPER